MMVSCVLATIVPVFSLSFARRRGLETPRALQISKREKPRPRTRTCLPGPAQNVATRCPPGFSVVALPRYHRTRLSRRGRLWSCGNKRHKSIGLAQFERDGFPLVTKKTVQGGGIGIRHWVSSQLPAAVGRHTIAIFILLQSSGEWPKRGLERERGGEALRAVLWRWADSKGEGSFVEATRRGRRR